MSRPTLPDHFSALRDPRRRGKVVYPLAEIMLLVLCATLAGAEDFVEFRHRGWRKLVHPARHDALADDLKIERRLRALEDQAEEAGVAEEDRLRM